MPDDARRGDPVLAPSRLNGVPAIVAVRPTLYRSLRVTASLPLAEALRAWKQNRKVIGAACLALVALTLVAGVLAQWQFNRLARRAQGPRELWLQERDRIHEAGEGEWERDLGNGLGVRIVDRRTREGGVVSVFHDVTASERRLSQAKANAEAPRQALRILVAEDNDVNQILINAVLARMGHCVHLVANGQQAVEAVRRGDYDVVLMDLQMPGMDGMEATQATRALDDSQASLPIIAMTANAFDEDRRPCLAAGMDDCVAKPIDVAQLARAIARSTVAVE